MHMKQRKQVFFFNLWSNTSKIRKKKLLNPFFVVVVLSLKQIHKVTFIAAVSKSKSKFITPESYSCDRRVSHFTNSEKFRITPIKPD